MRVRTTRAVASVVAGACAAAAAGCGVVTNPEQVIPSGHVEAPTILDDSVDRETLEQAYAQIAAHELEQSVRPELLDPRRDEFTSDDLSDGLVESFTPEVRTEWRRLVRAAKRGDPEAREAVRVLRYFDLDAPGLSLPADGEPVVRQRILGGTVSVEPPPRPSRISPGDVSPEAAESAVELVVDLEHAVTIELRDGRRPVELDLRRSVRYELVPAPGEGERRWLIADFDGEYELKEQGAAGQPSKAPASRSTSTASGTSANAARTSAGSATSWALSVR